MGFIGAIKSCLSQYVTFSGRAPRSEFWFFALFAIGGNIVAGILDPILGTSFGTGPQASGSGILTLIWGLALLLPNISVAVRRLHDRDRSGWWYWLFLIPLVGAIWLLVWFFRRGTVGANRFGPDPLALSAPGATPT
jgi:uncharacterized membrane protein YhaH (DUF805 family)